MTIDEFFESVYRPLKLRNRSQNTIRLYRHSIRSFSLWLGRQASLDDFQSDTVSLYLAALNDRGLSKFTVNKERSQLLAIWNFAIKRGLVTVFPDVLAEPVPRRAPLAWQLEEFGRILDACNRCKGRIGPIEEGKYWRALLLTIFDTAERIGAVMQLRWSHITSDGWLTVPYDARKGKTGDKVHKLHAETIAALRDIAEPARPKIFPWPYTTTYLWRRYERLLRSAGVDSDYRSKFHRIRRTVASYYAAAGGDATQLLDHADPRTTMKYLDPRLVSPKQPSEIVPRPSMNPHPKDDDHRRTG